MAQFDSNRFASIDQRAETPQDLFDAIDRQFHFTRDVCASAENAKCAKYWTEEDDCLSKEWDGINWMNPPYKTMRKFVEKAYGESGNAVTVCLLPARTNTRWWHDYCMRGEVYFICGRPKFVGYKHGFPQPLAIVVFGRGRGVMGSFFLGEENSALQSTGR